MTPGWIIAAVIGFLTCVGGAQAQCRQALVIALDVSGSVDSAEYRLQLDGLASALRNGEVEHAFLARTGNPVHITVFEWSGPHYQRLLLNWTAITDRATLFTASAHLAGLTRRPAPPRHGIRQCHAIWCGSIGKWSGLLATNARYFG